MNADVKKEIKEIIETMTTARLSLAESHKKLIDIVTDEEEAIDELPNQDSDSALARREKMDELREAVDQLEDLVTILEDDVLGKIEV